MTIHYTCPHCANPMRVPDDGAGRKVRCPHCSGPVTIPDAVANEPEEEIVMAEAVPPRAATDEREAPWEIPLLDDLHGPRKVRQFLDPPFPPAQAPGAAQAGAKGTTPSKAPGDAGRVADHAGQAADDAGASPFAREGATQTPAPKPQNEPGELVQRMLTALLDPRSIQWLLTLGGGLMVLGGLIWLISYGLLDNPWIVAAFLVGGSLTVLLAGWFVVLRTRFHMAGQALTFLGCVCIALNLWFLHAQGLILLEQGLWIGGLICVLLYVGTVWVLRDPLFMYAVEAGVTLTAVLLLANFGLAGDATPLSALLMALALVSIHAHKAFPAKTDEFSQDRYGLPLFWCGHAQLAAALSVLLGTQLAGWISGLGTYFELPPDGILLTNSRWLPAFLWLAGAYAYVYSDLVVRRVGVYMYLAAVALVMAESTFIGSDLLGLEGMIVTLAMTATAISIIATMIPRTEERFARVAAPLALLLSGIPVLLGLTLHVASTSLILEELGKRRETTWLFVGAMLLVAVANRVSAALFQQRSRGLSAAYLAFSAGSLVVAAAGLLRLLGFAAWQVQAPWLMAIPILYLVAARLWRGKSPERPLTWIAQTTTVVILMHVLFGVTLALSRGFEPAMHLGLALILAEAAVFYALARYFHGSAANTYVAIAAACAAIWQSMLYVDLPQELFVVAFAVAGLAMLLGARALGVREESHYTSDGRKRTVAAGRGATLFRAGNGVLSIAILAAFLKGLARVAAVGLESRALTGFDWLTLLTVTVAAGLAAIVSARSDWRRIYGLATMAMVGLIVLTVSVAWDVSLWRKLQVVSVGLGLFLLGTGYVGRFREEDAEQPGETVSLCLWLGSLLAAFPLLTAVFVHWGSAGEFAVYDELALIVVTLLMLATGIVWRVKAATLLGGGTLLGYLCVLIVSLLYQPQIAVGIYLTAGGFLLFAVGLALAMSRDYLLALPKRIANREGVFRVISWR